MDEGFQSQLVAREDWWERSETTHAKDGVGLEITDDFFTKLGGPPCFPKEGDHFGGECRRFGDGRDREEVEVGVFGRGLRVDFFLRDEQQWLMTTSD